MATTMVWGHGGLPSSPYPVQAKWTGNSLWITFVVGQGYKIWSDPACTIETDETGTLAYAGGYSYAPWYSTIQLTQPSGAALAGHYVLEVGNPISKQAYTAYSPTGVSYTSGQITTSTGIWGNTAVPPNYHTYTSPSTTGGMMISQAEWDELQRLRASAVLNEDTIRTLRSEKADLVEGMLWRSTAEHHIADWLDEEATDVDSPSTSAAYTTIAKALRESARLRRKYHQDEDELI